VDLRDPAGHRVADARAWFSAIPQPFPSLAAVHAVFGHTRAEFGAYMAECVEERADGYHLLCRIPLAVEIAAGWAERDEWAALEQVRCPVLLLEAEESIAPPGQMERMAHAIPGARHLRVPGSGHLLHASAPAAYRNAVEAFLAGS
jgi:pimeloyl-ACP methyl ester carboxylesterase